MGIAQVHNDRYKYLEDRIEENGGLEHLEESEEWFQLGATEDGGPFDHDHWDVYMHRTRFFRATVYYEKKDGEKHEYTDEMSGVRVEFTEPRHHYDDDAELPPIHSVYTKDPADE
mgnify:CR=1 FL=1